MINNERKIPSNGYDQAQHTAGSRTSVCLTRQAPALFDSSQF